MLFQHYLSNDHTRTIISCIHLLGFSDSLALTTLVRRLLLKVTGVYRKTSRRNHRSKVAANPCCFWLAKVTFAQKKCGLEKRFKETICNNQWCTRKPRLFTFKDCNLTIWRCIQLWRSVPLNDHDSAGGTPPYMQPGGIPLWLCCQNPLNRIIRQCQLSAMINDSQPSPPIIKKSWTIINDHHQLTTFHHCKPWSLLNNQLLSKIMKMMVYCFSNAGWFMLNNI